MPAAAPISYDQDLFVMARPWGVAALACVLLGCSFDHERTGTRFRCDAASRCPDGTACSPGGFCEAPGGDVDAGETDAAAVDTPPILVHDAETSWTLDAPGATKATPEFDVLAGDVLVAYGISEDWTVALASISGGGLEWDERQMFADADHAWIGLWTATAGADAAMSVQFTLAADADGFFGGGVAVFRGSDGVGTTAIATGDGAAQLELTTTRDRSAIVVANGDWNAQMGPRTWRDDAGTIDETSYFFEAGIYAAYGGVHPDASVAGTYEVGLSAPVSQVYSLVAIEVFGSAGAARSSGSYGRQSSSRAPGCVGTR